MGYSNKYPHEIMSSKKHKKGSLVKKIASFLAVFFILMSVGYGVGIVPESWIDAIEYIASPLDGPQGLWKGDKNTGDTQTSSQDNAAVQDAGLWHTQCGIHRCWTGGCNTHLQR